MKSIVFAAIAVLTLFKVGLADEAEISFNRDIRPILSDHCFACHGPDADAVATDLRASKKITYAID